MLMLSIKQAEVALSDGRLDEAFALANNKVFQSHRKGQNLISKLAKALLKRATEHFTAGHAELALADCTKSEKLAGNTPAAAELRKKICLTMSQKLNNQKLKQNRIDRARGQIKDGFLSVGERIINDTDQKGYNANLLLDEAADMRLRIDALINSIEEAVNRKDIEEAVEILTNNTDLPVQNKKLTAVTATVRSKTADIITCYLNAGRIDLAENLLEKLHLITSQTSSVKELSLIVKQCKLAAELLGQAKFRNAVEILNKLQILLPSASWLDKAIDQAVKGAESLEALRIGPLGLISDESPVQEKLFMTNDHQETNSNLSKEPVSKQNNNQKLPGQFVLQIDGIGSYLVVPENKVTIGAISSSARPTVGLMAEPDLPTMTIERAGEDYFIKSAEPITINSSSTLEKLLVTGDKVAASARCRMKFVLPNAASTTAMLQLTSAQLGRADVRDIILLDRDILIGPQGGNHICADIDSRIALTLQQGKLVCRSKQATAALSLNKPLSVFGLTMVITEFK